MKFDQAGKDGAMGETMKRDRERASIPAPERPKCARCGAVLRVTYTRRVNGFRKSFCDCQVCDLVNVYVEPVEGAGEG